MRAGPATLRATSGGSERARRRAAPEPRLLATSRRRGCDRVVAIPGHGALETFAQRCLRLEAEQLARAGCVDASPRLAVRHRRVPGDLPPEADDVGDELRELADRDLLARAEVHGLGSVVALGCEHDALDAVLDVEELARWRAVAPEHHFFLTGAHLPDEVGDHMRVGLVEVVAWPVEVGRQQEDRVEAVLLSIG